MAEIRCWEYMRCGRQPGGDRAAALGPCSAAAEGARECWATAGTMSGRQVEGTFALKLETCIICSYYNMMQERSTKKTQSRFFLFGQYLSSKDLITCDDVIRARALQLKNNQKIGVLAVRKGMLTDDQVQKILIIQEETLKKFGEIAMDLGFLTEEQVKELVLEQEDSYLFFGEALVQLGVLTEATMLLHLKDFNSLKLRRRLEGLSGSR